MSVKDRNAEWERAIDATKNGAIDAFYKLENPIYDLINMSVILEKLFFELEKDDHDGRPILAASQEEWHAVCFAMRKVNEMAKGLIDIYLVGHNLACADRYAAIAAHMAATKAESGKRHENT